MSEIITNASLLEQEDFLEPEAARSLLDQLLTDSRLYTKSQDYKDLIDFVVRLRNFAPFNAMLLHVQKPGLSYAASARDWWERFRRYPKDQARPLLILWPFGPVGLVYDVMDTEGNPLPEDVASFFARGEIKETQFNGFIGMMGRNHIFVNLIDQGDRRAGSIGVMKRPVKPKNPTDYGLNINMNHPLPVKFSTLAHELGHLFLGHLGGDMNLSIPERRNLEHTRAELEAESVAYLVCERNGIKSKSETYLTSYVTGQTTVEDIDLYLIMRAAGRVETLLKLTSHTSFQGKSARG